jgi:hypothetical protein
MTVAPIAKAANPDLLFNGMMRTAGGRAAARLRSEIPHPTAGSRQTAVAERQASNTQAWQ